MNRSTIAIIKENDIKLDRNCTIDYINEHIHDFITIKEISCNELMDVVVDSTKLTQELMGDTSICYQNHKYIYQLCHLSMKNNGNKDEKYSINGISSYLVCDRTEIYGSSVLIKSKIKDDYTCEPSFLTTNEISTLLYHNFVHTGVKIDVDGVVTEYKFYDNPLENMPHTDNLKWLNISIFNFNLILYIQTNPIIDKINKKATVIFGKNRIHGAIYMAVMETQDIYSSINIDTVNKLIKILSNSRLFRELTDIEANNMQKKNDELPIIMNRYCILEKRCREHKFICHNCNKDIENKDIENKVENSYKICGGCYRMQYCSKKCQQTHWNMHKSDCLYHNMQINKKLHGGELV